jgi:hypothetical protein
MKTIKRLVTAALVCGAYLSGGAHAFELDMPSWELRKQIGKTLIGDMAIGDKGYIDDTRICFLDQSLYVAKISPIFKKDDFKYRGYDVQIEVLPAARAKLKLLDTKGEKISQKILSDFLEKLNRRVSCRFWEQSFFALGPRDRSLIKIVDINGFTKVSELLNSAKAQK